MSDRANCWEIKTCGREPGGATSHQMGVCIAAKDSRYHGLNHGRNAGRICWVVDGTLCGGRIQGSYAEKRATCMGCEVFAQVRTEEGEDFVLLKTARRPAATA